MKSGTLGTISLALIVGGDPAPLQWRPVPQLSGQLRHEAARGRSGVAVDDRPAPTWRHSCPEAGDSARNSSANGPHNCALGRRAGRARVDGGRPAGFQPVAK
jgi:hypothetical protein